MAIAVSPGTAALIAEVVERRRAWGVLPEPPDRLLAPLAAIEERGEPGAALLLWPALDGRPPQLQHRILEVMTALLAGTAAARIVACIAEVRGAPLAWPAESRDRWWRLTPAEIGAWAADRPACAGLLVLLSGHHSGHVREAAVRGLDGLTLSCVLPALRDRLNDWVEPVRRAALQAMRRFLSPEHAGALIGSLEVLEALRRCGRADHLPLLERMQMVLRETAARPHLEAGLSSPVAAIRRGCFAILLQATDAAADCLDRGLRSADPCIRLRAAQAIHDLPAERRSSALVERLAASSLRPLRQIALELIARQGDAERLHRFLLDPSPTLREFARYHLGRLLGRFDARQAYRAALAAAGPALAQALAGLGETGDADDVPTLLAHGRHPRTSVRISALRALARLAPDDLTAPFLAVLGDRSGRVRQTATAALARRRAALPSDELVRWAARAAAPGRRCALLLLAHHPVERRLPALLPFLVDADDGIRTLAERLCLRSVDEAINPFRRPDPWQVWVAQHAGAWSPGHRERVHALVEQRLRTG